MLSRNRLSLPFLLVALAAVTTGCPKKEDDKKSSSSKKDDDDGDKKKKKKGGDDDKADEPKGDEPDKKKAKGGSGCKLPEGDEIKADFTITKGCKLSPKNHIHVSEGATLTIEPGVKISFAASAYLWIANGKVVAKGTDDEPIVLTSAASSPSSGDWQGVIFADQITAGNVLDHVTIEYAGHDGHAHGAVTFEGSPSGARVSITNSTIQHNKNAGVHDMTKASFAKFENNTLKDNDKTSMIMAADAMGSIGTGNKLGDPIRTEGNVVTSQTWTAFGVPVVVTNHLVVDGEKESINLRLSEKTVLKFTKGHHLWLGAGKGSGLTAKGVTFTSAEETPHAGDWQGIIFADKIGTVTLEDCVIEYAGAEGHSHAAITWEGIDAKKTKGVSIKSCTFKHNEHGALHSPDHDCGPAAAPDAKNKSEGAPLCRPAS